MIRLVVQPPPVNQRGYRRAQINHYADVAYNVGYTRENASRRHDSRRRAYRPPGRGSGAEPSLSLFFNDISDAHLHVRLRQRSVFVNRKPVACASAIPMVFSHSPAGQQDKGAAS